MRTKLLLLSIFVSLVQVTKVEAQAFVVTPDWDDATINFYSPTIIIEQSVADALMQQEVRHFQDARAPRFLLIDQKEKFAMGIGGFARLVSGNEFGGIINTTTDQGFQPSLIGMPSSDYPRSQYRLSAATSQVFLKMVGRTRNLGDVSVYISANFQGDNYAPQLRQAYIKFMGFTVGQVWNTMTDEASTPPTIDYASPSGWTGFINPTIRYELPFARDYMQFGVSAEFPEVNGTWSTKATSTLQAVPDFTGYLQVNFGQGRTGHLRAAALIRSMVYDNLSYNSYEYNTGWGTQISGTLNFCPSLKMYYRGIYGEGIGSYINDLNTQNVDLVPGEGGTMDVLQMWGALGGLQYSFSPRVFASATYSTARLCSGDAYYNPEDQFKYSQYISGNIFWKVTCDMHLAVEYLYGTRKDQGGASGSANRVNIMAQYNF